jgi:hypothetical protein
LFKLPFFQQKKFISDKVIFCRAGQIECIITFFSNISDIASSGNRPASTRSKKAPSAGNADQLRDLEVNPLTF